VKLLLLGAFLNQILLIILKLWFLRGRRVWEEYDTEANAVSNVLTN